MDYRARWGLRDVTVSADQYPDTFQIPSIELRSRLHPGQAAKLIFEIYSDVSDEFVGERMWVIVTEVAEDGYKGILDSDPTIEHPFVKSGALIEFNVRHIASIDTPPRDYLKSVYPDLFG